MFEHVFNIPASTISPVLKASIYIIDNTVNVTNSIRVHLKVIVFIGNISEILSNLFKDQIIITLITLCVRERTPWICDRVVSSMKGYGPNEDIVSVKNVQYFSSKSAEANRVVSVIRKVSICINEFSINVFFSNCVGKALGVDCRNEHKSYVVKQALQLTALIVELYYGLNEPYYGVCSCYFIAVFSSKN